jgi:hypothetical protein
MFAQSALWGVLAGGTAAWLTTPFDVLTTNILTAIEEPNADKRNDKAGEMEMEIEAMTDDQVSSSSISLPPQLVQYGDSKQTIIDYQLQRSILVVKEFIVETGALFQKSFYDVMSKEATVNGKINALFNGAFERVLFFGPAAMIFFTTYESAFNLISLARERHALWF